MTSPPIPHIAAILAAILFLIVSPADSQMPPNKRAAIFGGYAPTIYDNLAADNSTLNPSLYTYSGASLRTMTDSTGANTYAPNNLLLNSATLSTQNVTTTPINYILTFYGTGSVALTGTASHTLVGTGVSNQVYYVFTATAGTLTATVSGSVTNATLSAITYETIPRPGDQVVTTSSAYYGPPFDFSLSSIGSPLGLRIEEARTNLILNSGNVATSVASWSTIQATAVTASGTSPSSTTTASLFTDNTTNSAHIVYPTNVVTTTTSATYSTTFYLKRGTGRYITVAANDGGGSGAYYAVYDLQAGTVTQSGTSGSGSTFVSASITANVNSWWRVTLVGSNTNTSTYTEIAGATSGTYTPDLGGRQSYIGTGLTWFVWGAQLELGSFATSYIPTAASSASRVADVVGIIGTGLALLEGAADTALVETNGVEDTTYSGTIIGGSSRTVVLSNSTTAKINVASGTSNPATGSGTFATTQRLGWAWSSGNTNGFLTGGALSRVFSSYGGGSSSFYLGSTTGSSAFLDGHVSKFVLWNRTIPTNFLQGYTVLGASL